MIGLIDADLLDRGTRHPNLALMKISGFHKAKGSDVRLLHNYTDVDQCSSVFISKVFTRTVLPVITHPRVIVGGTGVANSVDLPKVIEHHMPDYHLYDSYPGLPGDYHHYSIGFTTRGCFRKCDFCVNKKYDQALPHSPISEFFDPSRKYIYLWDDNILAFPGWRQVFDSIIETGRGYQFRQGLDLRLMTAEKAQVITTSKYRGDFIFAFDHYRDQELISSKLKLWRDYTDKTSKLYLLCAHESQDADDIESVFKRIDVLREYNCIPYIMRYESYEKSQYKGMYINLARWCNQPSIFRKMSFREFCETHPGDSAAVKYLRLFENDHAQIALKYFDKK